MAPTKTRIIGKAACWMGWADGMRATKAPRTVGTKKAKEEGRDGLNTGMDAAATTPTMRNTRCLTSERPASAKPIDGQPQPIPSAKLMIVNQSAHGCQRSFVSRDRR